MDNFQYTRLLNGKQGFNRKIVDPYNYDDYKDRRCGKDGCQIHLLDSPPFDRNYFVWRGLKKSIMNSHNAYCLQAPPSYDQAIYEDKK
ncbi:hypothetical protein AX774_g6667 [Zancudomyces culisetae]|uniref:Uncharacterized protein n=1 Tax=Zancudomyces culisetae TaxID=1213189 RepID=A0A1R1PG45_ZANCU|nr:hypothetical protein AX774_g6667 [Zancudomyces culisetae]|eukprot:OMH79908.1 hypothetical protein AX774_g6667 [Zancudomyces culisetae]